MSAFLTIRVLPPCCAWTKPVLEIIGHSIRNSVGFDWQPSSGDLWVSDNGRDMMGDDIPSDEINVIPAASEKAPLRLSVHPLGTRQRPH